MERIPLDSGGQAVPPGLSLRTHFVNTPVVSCYDAAAQKGIDLRCELKTLILDTTVGVVAVHVPGDRTASLRLVKRALNCAEACLSSRATLSALGLAPGTVSALLPPVWAMKHLVCESVFDQDVISTNNGTLTGYFLFSPDVLRSAQQLSIGHYSLPSHSASRRS